MRDVLGFLAFYLLWFALNRWILPRLGVGT